ncbi:TetR family transcriptional regulator [Novosphingobium album (ex Hu et al. 2023)]|uniref:TetR/AcrR family transcriptional regulator n=1 Tax=Novosphingobium album (ex Hu et al. 2023) TaxID=2930093 RepID=A0ABT0B3A8_9SPHN|nr:TetR family transcriptional regulator [Novosphingobium album (ex Hu et al. 2023)]MCJ2179401.1 TetR/AcrR family transcriptional regulator [Novosphingobium album (ex Hu et al. 2023)]
MTSRIGPKMQTDTSAAAADTREKIILAAERLFGERGIDAVSLRQIRIEAGQNNNSAVHYHFKDRTELVSAILALRVGQMEPVRRRMLDDLDRRGGRPDLESLMKILVIPQLDITDEAGRRPYIRFTSEYLTRFRASGIGHPGDSAQTAPALADLMERFYGELFWLDRDVALMRLTAATLLFLNLVTQWEAGLTFAEHRLDLDLVSDEALTMAVAVLEARPSRTLMERYQK